MGEENTYFWGEMRGRENDEEYGNVSKEERRLEVERCVYHKAPCLQKILNRYLGILRLAYADFSP
jgi:hypothetical protein